jgi:hypothetical protein
MPLIVSPQIQASYSPYSKSLRFQGRRKPKPAGYLQLRRAEFEHYRKTVIRYLGLPANTSLAKAREAEQLLGKDVKPYLARTLSLPITANFRTISRQLQRLDVLDDCNLPGDTPFGFERLLAAARLQLPKDVTLTAIRRRLGEIRDEWGVEPRDILIHADGYKNALQALMSGLDATASRRETIEARYDLGGGG